MSFGLNRFAGRVKGLLFAGVTFAGMSLVLVVPALFGASTQLLLHAAALIVGIQAAQSSVVQVGRSLSASLLGKNWLLVLGAAVLTILEILSGQNSIVATVLATISGSLLGLLLGQSSLLVLTGKGGTEFQLFQAIRSLALVLAATLAVVADRLLNYSSPMVMTIAVAALAYYRPRVGRRRMGYGEPNQLTKGTSSFIALGLVASLYYRNDVNWVRTAVSATNEFILWHYALVVYSAVQGLVGFLLIQVLFAERQRWGARIHRWIRRFSLVGVCAWLAITTLCLLVLPTLPVVVSVFGCSLLAALVGLISGFAHVLELNWAPYIAGVVGASALSLLLVSGTDARLAMVIESTAIGSITLVLILIQRRRACNSSR